jgi:hypothetical protein
MMQPIKHTMIALTASLLLTATQVLAEGNSVSGQATLADWLDRLPVIAVATVITLIVDALFIVPALRKLRSGGTRSRRRPHQTGA